MRRVTLLFLFMAPASAAQAQDGNLECFATLAPPAKVIACTRSLAEASLPAPTRALALLVRAGTYAATGDKSRALADYDAAIALAPDPAEIGRAHV